jgi:hypothetical protein
MWSRWRLSTLLYFLSLSERILGEIQQILKKSNRKFCHILGIRYLIKIILILIIFFTILGFSIWKAYYVSEQKTKQVSLYSLFVREYITRISQLEKLHCSKLLAKIRKHIEMYICIVHICITLHVRNFHYNWHDIIET